MLDWPNDVSSLADALGIGRFAVCGHSFGGPYVAACARRLTSRVTSAAIVAGISPLSVSGATRGMAAPVRAMLWLGARAPVLTRPFVAAMARSVEDPDQLRKGLSAEMSDEERALLEEPRFAGFLENLGEMVRHGSNGAYWDARVFLGDWGFACEDIAVPVSLFYGTADRSVPVRMGEYYRDSIPGSQAVFYEGEGHFIMYSRAREILDSLLGDDG
jgi:pimeloyl-ACP methyl ester carboxylesterase